MTAPRLNRCSCGLRACPRSKAADRSRGSSKARRLLGWIAADRGLQLDETEDFSPLASVHPIPGSEASPGPSFVRTAGRVLDESAAPAGRVLDPRFVARFELTPPRELDPDQLTVRVVDARHRVSMNARSIGKVVESHGRDDRNNLQRRRHHAAHEDEGEATAAGPSKSHPTRGSARPRVGEEGARP